MALGPELITDRRDDVTDQAWFKNHYDAGVFTTYTTFNTVAPATDPRYERNIIVSSSVLGRTFRWAFQGRVPGGQSVVNGQLLLIAGGDVGSFPYVFTNSFQVIEMEYTFPTSTATTIKVRNDFPEPATGTPGDVIECFDHSLREVLPDPEGGSLKSNKALNLNLNMGVA